MGGGGGPGRQWQEVGGLECAHSRSLWQPVRDMQRGGKSLIARSPPEGPTLPSSVPPPLPPFAARASNTRFALAFSQTPECACWLHGGCSWNRDDKAQTVFEMWADRVQPAWSHA